MTDMLHGSGQMLRQADIPRRENGPQPLSEPRDHRNDRIECEAMDEALACGWFDRMSDNEWDAYLVSKGAVIIGKGPMRSQKQRARGTLDRWLERMACQSAGAVVLPAGAMACELCGRETGHGYSGKRRKYCVSCRSEANRQRSRRGYAKRKAAKGAL